MSMLVSHQWLEDYIGVALDVKSLPDMLTNAGLEVDSVTTGALLSEYFVVGRVLKVNSHPNANKLNLCKVDVGTEILDIVCGCASVRADVNVIVAKIGAILPNGLKIKASKLRGEPSNGMLCSLAELGLVKESSGIILFEQAITPGTKASELIRADDVIYDISLTPDRGDCFSIRGIAREAYALQYGKSMPKEAVEFHSHSIEQEYPATSQYLLLDIKYPNQESLLAWQIRLQVAGYSSQNFWVDFTQYFMHESGQPMHAFDADKIHGTPHVRYAQIGESLLALDGKEYELSPDILIVADASGPIAIAGVIGGMATAVGPDTKAIKLEIATFSKEAIAISTQKLRLNTAASDRFVRGVDPLVLHICCHDILEYFTKEKVTVNGYTQEPQPNVLELTKAKFYKVLGDDADFSKLVVKLEERGFGVEIDAFDAKVIVPTFRTDISTNIDLIEEILRLQGHQAWPASDFSRISSVSKANNISFLAKKLVAHGFHEMITYSFIDPDLVAATNFPTSPILANPMSKDMSLMRPSLLPGLLERLDYNNKRQQDGARVFEIGKVFSNEQELNMIAAITYGSLPKTWHNSHDDDFFFLKSVVNDLVAHLPNIEYKPCSDLNFYHPHACAVVYSNEVLLGYIGVLHPKIVAKFALKNVIGFEFNYDYLSLNSSKLTYSEFSKYPVSNKDLSFFATHDVKYADILSAINDLKIKEIKNIKLSDLYISEKNSYSIALTFQSDERTLNDSEILSWMQDIVTELKDKYNLELRGDLCQFYNKQQ